VHGAGRLGETLRRQGGTVLATVAFEGATKVYPDGTTAVSSLDLAIPDGQLMVLVGPSGCG